MNASPTARFARFLGAALGIVAAVCALGFVPTRNLAGPSGLVAMAAGCGISLLAAVLAGGLLVAVDAPTGEARMRRGFLAMIIRLAAVVVVGAAAIASGSFSREPLLFWIGAAYLALLPLEVRLAIL